MRKTKETAYAKINLSLDVLGRLENGYHIVKMIMQTIDLYDELVFETQDRECPSMEITLVSDSGEIPGGEDNLIVRAVRRMEAKYGILWNPERPEDHLEEEHSGGCGNGRRQHGCSSCASRGEGSVRAGSK